MKEIKKKLKVSLFVHDLSSNPIVRAYPFAKALQRLGYEVEILGFTYNTDEIYAPYKNEFEYKYIRCYLDIRSVVSNAYRLSKLATGDIAYCFKPVWGTLFPALLYSGFGFRKKLVLDAEDNELWDLHNGNGWRDLRQNSIYPINPIYNKLLHPFAFFAKQKSVATRSLQKRYGGHIILHGPDHNTFDPKKFADKISLRKKYGLPENKMYLIFAGTPVFYNGLPFLIMALKNTLENWHIILVGNPKHKFFIEAKEELGVRCHVLGFIENSLMPEVLKLADVAPIIQTSMPSTLYQMPAKSLEAMCMELPLIVTNVADLPILVGEDRGWIIGKQGSFQEILNFIANSPEEIRNRGIKCREYFIEHCSVNKISETLKSQLGF